MRCRLNSGLLAVAICCASFVAGCGNEKEQKAEPVAAAAEGPPATAEGAVLAVVNGLRDNRLGALWDFLPAGFQKDLNQLLHDFASRMDPEIWDKGVAALRKLTRVLKEKKQFLRPRAEAVAAGRPATDWGQIAEVLEMLLASDLADLEKLKTADAGKLLDQIGGQALSQARAFSKLGPRDFFGQNLEQLANLRVTSVRSSGDKATLRFEAPDQEPELLEFERVEGKWVPRNLKEGWIEMMGEARARLSLLSPDNLAQHKPAILGLLRDVDGVLDGLLAARTQDEFNAAGARAAELAGMIAAFTGPPEPEIGAASPDEGEEPEPAERVGIVTVTVKGQLGEGEQDELRQRLQSLADPGGRPFAEITGDDDSTTIQLGPVADLEAFAKKLDFLEVTEVNREMRTITGTMK